MNTSSTQDPLELEVEDFGPIGKAKINLRPLTVFVGPSNTGKSYLAILIYALHRYFGQGGWPTYWMFDSSSRKPKVQKLLRQRRAPLKEWTQQMLRNLDSLQGERRNVLPAPIVDMLHSGFNKLGSYLDTEICRCFGIDKASLLIRKVNSDTSHIVFRKLFSKHSAVFENVFTIGSKETGFTASFPKGLPVASCSRARSSLPSFEFFQVL